MFDFNTLVGLVTIINSVFSCGLFFYMRRVAKQEKTEMRFKGIEKGLANKVDAAAVGAINADRDRRCAEHLSRTEKIEIKSSEMRVELDLLPSHRQFEELARSIKDLTGELRNTQGRLEGVNRAVDLINEFLINQGGKQ